MMNFTLIIILLCLNWTFASKTDDIVGFIELQIADSFGVNTPSDFVSHRFFLLPEIDANLEQFQRRAQGQASQLLVSYFETPQMFPFGIPIASEFKNPIEAQSNLLYEQMLRFAFSKEKVSVAYKLDGNSNLKSTRDSADTVRTSITITNIRPLNTSSTDNKYSQSNTNRRNANEDNIETVSHRRIAAVLVEIKGEKSLECTKSDVENILWKGVNSKKGQSVTGLIHRFLHGRYSLTTDSLGKDQYDVLGPVTITTGSKCDPSSWRTQITNELVKSGVNLALFNSYIYVMPSATPCSWIGLANVRCTDCYVFSRNCFIPDIYIHEIGHNVGFGHSSTSDAEYGDPTSVMGNLWLRDPELIWNYGPSQLEFAKAISSDKIFTSNTLGSLFSKRGRLASLHLTSSELSNGVYQIVKMEAGTDTYYFSFNDYSGAPYRGYVTIIRETYNGGLYFQDKLGSGDIYFENGKKWAVRFGPSDDFGQKEFAVSVSSENESQLEFKLLSISGSDIDTKLSQIKSHISIDGDVVDLSLPVDRNYWLYYEVTNNDNLFQIQRKVTFSTQNDENAYVEFYPSYLVLQPQTTCYTTANITLNHNKRFAENLRQTDFSFVQFQFSSNDGIPTNFASVSLSDCSPLLTFKNTPPYSVILSQNAEKTAMIASFELDLILKCCNSINIYYDYQIVFYGDGQIDVHIDDSKELNPKISISILNSEFKREEFVIVVDVLGKDSDGILAVSTQALVRVRPSCSNIEPSLSSENVFTSIGARNSFLVNHILEFADANECNPASFTLSVSEENVKTVLPNSEILIRNEDYFEDKEITIREQTFSVRRFLKPRVFFPLLITSTDLRDTNGKYTLTATADDKWNVVQTYTFARDVPACVPSEVIYTIYAYANSNSTEEISFYFTLSNHDTWSCEDPSSFSISFKNDDDVFEEIPNYSISLFPTETYKEAVPLKPKSPIVFDKTETEKKFRINFVVTKNNFDTSGYIDLRYGYCDRKPPNLSTSEQTHTLARGQTKSLRLNVVRAELTTFCETYQYFHIKQKKQINGLKVSHSESLTTTLSYTSSVSIRVVVEKQATPFPETDLCFVLTDTDNEELSAEFCFKITLTSCTYEKPLLKLEKQTENAKYEFAAAKADSFSLQFTLTNQNSKDCETESFTINGQTSNSDVYANPVSLLIASEETKTGMMEFYIRPFSDSRSVSISAIAYLRSDDAFSSTAEMNEKIVADLGCSFVPDLPFISDVENKTDSLLSVSHVIHWQACQPTYRCCSPITYIIFESDVEVGRVVDSTSFTISGREPGKLYKYSIQLFDHYRTDSAKEPYMCNNVFESYGGERDWKAFTQFLLAILSSVFCFVAMGVVYIITLKRDKVFHEIKTKIRRQEPQPREDGIPDEMLELENKIEEMIEQ